MTDFRDQLRNPGCELCPLHETAEFVCLMGSGPPKAKIMIVGEAPGAREDENHEAFVGPAGKLLNAVLKDYGKINREDCYVTNVAKCRPPNNRTPHKTKEVKVCVNTYFDAEVQAVQPGFMLLLGNAALAGITGRSGITKYAGTTWRMDFGDGKPVKVLACLHPAAVLHNPKYGEVFFADITRFGRLVRGKKTSPKTSIRIIRTKAQLRWLKAHLMDAKEISWDIETYTAPTDPPYKRTNFQDWHGEDSQIASVAFSTVEGKSYVIPLWHDQTPWSDPQRVLDFIKFAMERRGANYIGHNGKFDARWFHSKGIMVPQTFDTMLAAHVLDENRPKGLKPLSRTLLGADAYDVGEELKNARKIPLRRLCVYNGKDTDYTLRLKHEFAEQLRQDPKTARIFKRLMMPASEALVEVEKAGVYIDPRRWQERHDQAQINVRKIYKYINQFVPEDMRPINLNSPPQVGRWLYGHLGLPILETTKTDAPSTREGVLLHLTDQHKAVEALLKYRKWAKYLSTYLLPWKYEWMDSNGRIHSFYKPHGTVTGRLSGEGGIQQVPRDPFIRSIIGARPGWTFVQSDYSQIELRIAAMVAHEKNLLAQYERGEDVHTLRAVKMTGKRAEDLTKEERKKAKPVNFGYLYSMGEAKFITYAFENYGVDFTEEEAHESREGFFADYPALRTWHARQKRLAARYGLVRSPLGRARHLPDVRSASEEVRAEAERQAINSPVQSTATDMMLLALIRLVKKFDPSEAVVVGTVHDSILSEVRNDVLDQYCHLIKDTMEDVAYVERAFECEITVPIVADVEVGTHWGETKEWVPR